MFDRSSSSMRSLNKKSLVCQAVDTGYFEKAHSLERKVVA